MKNKLKSISAELKKASKKHAGQAAKIDKLIKPKMSKLNKSSRMKRPKFIGPKIPSDINKVELFKTNNMAKAPSKFGATVGKVGGILGLAGSAIGIMQGLKGLKGKRQKPKVDKEKLKAVGRVQKPYLSKKDKVKKGRKKKEDLEKKFKKKDSTLRKKFSEKFHSPSKQKVNPYYVN
jgi:hypothetical protein